MVKFDICLNLTHLRAYTDIQMVLHHTIEMLFPNCCFSIYGF